MMTIMTMATKQTIGSFKYTLLFMKNYKLWKLSFDIIWIVWKGASLNNGILLFSLQLHYKIILTRITIFFSSIILRTANLEQNYFIIELQKYLPNVETLLKKLNQTRNAWVQREAVCLLIIVYNYSL